MEVISQWIPMNEGTAFYVSSQERVSVILSTSEILEGN